MKDGGENRFWHLEIYFLLGHQTQMHGREVIVYRRSFDGGNYEKEYKISDPSTGINDFLEMPFLVVLTKSNSHFSKCGRGQVRASGNF